VIKDRSKLSAAKRYSEFVELSDVQIVYKFAERVTPNADFNVTLFLNVRKYLENDTR